MLTIASEDRIDNAFMVGPEEILANCAKKTGACRQCMLTKEAVRGEEVAWLRVMGQG